MPACCAFGCNNRSSRKNTKQKEKEKEAIITYHKFPKNPERRANWIKAIRRVGWEPTDNSIVCSDHFTEDSFDRTSLSCVRLRDFAIPSIFLSYPTYLQKKVKIPRRTLERREPKTVSGITPILAANYLNSSTETSTVDVPQILNINEIPSTSTSTNISLPVPQKRSVIRMMSRTTSFSPVRRIHRDISPSKASLLRQIKNLKSHYRKKVNQLQQTKRRNLKRIATLSNVLKSIKNQNLLHEEQLQVLKNIGSFNGDILKRQLGKSGGSKLSRQYSAELRKFAVTLHYYSPAAYKYVRTAFNSCLPHPKTISKWYSSIDGAPGFTTEAFRAIKLRCEYSDKPLLASLCIDEMSIRRRIEFDGKKYHGYVNFGVETDDDSVSEAKDALVFMIVCINQAWKIPVAYFLVDGVNADQRYNLINICLSKCYQAGLRIISITFDGAASNITMMSKLGCNIIESISWFKHPDSKENVYLYPDPCHMLKNVRNAFGDKKVFFDYLNRKIDWKVIVLLHELQENEGLNLANRLKKVHINFKKQIMKVRLAAQLFSNSTAVALKFCCNQLKLGEFQNCIGTVEFIHIFNNLFDILNSKNLYQFGLKKALCQKNVATVLNTLESTENYIKNLKHYDGTKVIMSNRKIGFLGFLYCINSIRKLYADVVVENSLLMYIPTYKLNQDHLEMLFSVIRSQGGFNNNPTSRQFCTAYKKILVHSELKSTKSGNCIPLEEINILHVSSSKQESNAIKIINKSTNKNSLILEEHISINDDCDHMYESNPQEVTEYSTYIIAYISGFVVKYLKKKIVCEECLQVLERYPDKNEKELKFISSKDFGGLIYPSQDVINICKTTEKVIKQAIHESKGPHLNKKFTVLFLVSSVLKYYLNHSIFKELNGHIFDQNPFENHVINLIRAVSEKYVLIRLHYIVKNIPDLSKSKRQQLNKLILFEGW